MTAKKSTTKKSPVTLAEEYVKEVESSITSLAAELEPLQAEHDVLAKKGLLNPADLDRLADLQDSLIPRRAEHLEKLRTITLPDAVADFRRLELLDLAADGVDGIEAKHALYQRRITEAEAKAAQAFAEAREATDEWNAFVRPALRKAQEAGQDSRNPTDPDHPVTVEVGTLYPEKGKPTALNFGGESYRAANADRAACAAASRGDKHIADLIRLGLDEMTFSEVRRGRYS